MGKAQIPRPLSVRAEVMEPGRLAVTFQDGLDLQLPGDPGVGRAWADIATGCTRRRPGTKPELASVQRIPRERGDAPGRIRTFDPRIKSARRLTAAICARRKTPADGAFKFWPTAVRRGSARQAPYAHRRAAACACCGPFIDTRGLTVRESPHRSARRGARDEPETVGSCRLRLPRPF